MEELVLNTSQRRCIWASLLSFERALRWIRHLLTIEEEGILFHRELSLNKEDVELIIDRVDRALELMTEYTKKFNLNSIEENIGREIVAEMSISWENLEECRSSRISGYGDLSVESAEIIDETVDELVKINLEIMNIVEKVE